MKFSIQLAAALSIILLCSIFSVAFAQSSTINSVTSPTKTTLNSVFIVNNVTSANKELSNLDAWAVGNNGVIVHWNGNSWSTVTSPTTMNLYSIFMVNTTSGWAVGGSSNSGVILWYNCGSWSIWKNVSFSGYTNATDSINATLYSVTADSTGVSGWIVGAGGVALSWCGGTWFGFTNVTHNNLRSVSISHDSVNAWAVGDNGTIVRYNGSGWINVSSPTKANLYTVQMVNSTYGWAAGGSNSNGSVIVYNGVTWSNWTKYNFAPNNAITNTVNATIYSLSFENATSAWAVGSQGAVMYWNGTTWSCYSNVVNGTLWSVSVVHGVTGVNQAWAVGDNGIIIAFNGTNWVPEFPILVIPLLMGIGLVAAVLGKRLYKKMF
jgi:hypothetical protein